MLALNGGFGFGHRAEGLTQDTRTSGRPLQHLFKPAGYGVRRTLFAPLAIRLSISLAMQFTQQKKTSEQKPYTDWFIFYVSVARAGVVCAPTGLPGLPGAPSEQRLPGAGKLLSPKLFTVADSQKNRDCPSIRPSPEVRLPTALPIGTDTPFVRVYGFPAATCSDLFISYFHNLFIETISILIL